MGYDPKTRNPIVPSSDHGAMQGVDAPEPEELPPTTVTRSKPFSAENLAQFEQQQEQ